MLSSPTLVNRPNLVHVLQVNQIKVSTESRIIWPITGNADSAMNQSDQEEKKACVKGGKKCARESRLVLILRGQNNINNRFLHTFYAVKANGVFMELLVASSEQTFD